MMTAIRAWSLLVLAAGDGGAGPVPAAPRLLSPPPPANQPVGDVATDYRLQRATDKSGDLIYEGTGFDARVARDGSVTFDNKKVSALNLIPLLPGPPPSNVPTLETTLRSLRKKGRAPKPPANPDPTPDETRWPASTVSRYRPDPREECHYRRPCFFEARVILVGITATMDVGDQLMRLARQDPYRYQKARFLTATREMRVMMAARAHAEDLQSSAVELPRRLRAIVCDQRLPVRERRDTLEALRTELDATADADRFRQAIRRALDELDTPDAGTSCPPR